MTEYTIEAFKYASAFGVFSAFMVVGVSGQFPLIPKSTLHHHGLLNNHYPSIPCPIMQLLREDRSTLLNTLASIFTELLVAFPIFAELLVAFVWHAIPFVFRKNQTEFHQTFTNLEVVDGFLGTEAPSGATMPANCSGQTFKDTKVNGGMTGMRIVPA
ncbi:hypothetical protein MSAN_00841100 [Mycena sanguinolenta]|uniref:Uncharacterized protein n=1 Tax=Mycena sanguinolenta TaxID=230812 RepID=A0A8H6YVB0_9AGAR|nr:hypothetical protein MSAN_00841100 [Mycena sanguinolenta]